MNGTVTQLLHRPAATRVWLTSFESPLGMLHAASISEGACAIVFEDRLDALEPRLRRAFGPFFSLGEGDPHRLAQRLDRYFEGDLGALRQVPLAVMATAMQRHVWDLVRALPAGGTTSYVTVAERLGLPRGQRAVGVCLASNPVPLLVPCHRVVAASGALGSHPGGMVRKQWLLEHEGAPLVASRSNKVGARAKQAPRRNTALAGDGVELVYWPRYAAR